MANSEDSTSRENAAEPAGTPAGSSEAGGVLPLGEDLYQALFLAHPDGVVLTVEGRIALVNDRFAEMSGYSTEDAIGMVPSDLVIPEERGRIDERVQALLGGSQELPAEYSLLCKDGRSLLVDAHSKAIQHEGKPAILTVVRDISQQRLAEEARQASEERYGTLYELASDAFLTVLADGEIVDANIAAAELLGYTVDELKGLTGRDDIVAPEVFEETDRAWAEQLEERGQFLVDTLWVRKDGTRVPVAVSGKPLMVGDQEQLQLIGRDITERKQAEEALRALEQERFRRLLEVAPDGIVIVDDGGVIETVNARTEELFGYGRKELIGRPVELLIPERYHERHLTHRQAYATAPSARTMGSEMDLHGLRKDGSEFPVDISLNALRTDAGTSIIASIRDVTERVEAQESLRESEARFSTAFHDNPVPVAITRVSDGKLIDVNDAFLSMTGYRRSETAGRTTFELDLLVDTVEPEVLRTAIRERGTFRDFLGHIRKKTGDILYVLETATQIELACDPCLLITLFDITERKRPEAELQEMRDDLASKV